MPQSIRWSGCSTVFLFTFGKFNVHRGKETVHPKRLLLKGLTFNWIWSVFLFSDSALQRNASDDFVFPFPNCLADELSQVWMSFVCVVLLRKYVYVYQWAGLRHPPPYKSPRGYTSIFTAPVSFSYASFVSRPKAPSSWQHSQTDIVSFSSLGNVLKVLQCRTRPRVASKTFIHPTIVWAIAGIAQLSCMCWST